MMPFCLYMVSLWDKLPIYELAVVFSWEIGALTLEDAANWRRVGTGGFRRETAATERSK